MDIAATIRDARLATGLTQAELAERCGSSQATLCAYERGHKTPSADTLARVLAAAGVRLVAEPATRPVRTPGSRQLEDISHRFLRVIELAALLPVRHAPELEYPRLPSGRGPAA